MTVDQLCDYLGVARSTLYDWHAKGRAPRSIKLPGGQRRYRVTDVEAFLIEHEDGGAA